MADRKDQDQKLDSIKLRVEKEQAARKAAGLPSPSPSYDKSSPIRQPKDPSETIGDPNAPEHEWLEAAHVLNQEEEKQDRALDDKTKKDDEFNRKFLTVFLSLIIILSGAALANVFFNQHPAPIQEYVPVPRQETQDIDFKPYMDALQASIKSHWKPPAGGDHIVKVKFKVHKNGEISDLGFDRMSRSPEKDAAVMKAIIESMPSLPPLPEGSPENVDIMFTFEYHTHDGPGQSSQQ